MYRDVRTSGKIDHLLREERSGLNHTMCGIVIIKFGLAKISWITSNGDHKHKRNYMSFIERCFRTMNIMRSALLQTDKKQFNLLKESQHIDYNTYDTYSLRWSAFVSF